MLEIKFSFDLQRFSYITNTVAGAVLSGTSEADYISNSDGDTVQIYAAAGNDTIYNYFGYYATIDGGAGNDSISNQYGTYSTIDGGAGNDTIDIKGGNSSINGGAGSDIVSLNSYGSKNTITGGVGNDTFYDNSQSSNGQIYQYANGDGYDVIYNYGIGDTISITSGYYSSTVNGNNVIVYAYKGVNSKSANGAITLVGAAGKPVNIKGSFDIKPNSKIITNTSSGTVIRGTSGKDTIYNNSGDTVNIQAGAGNDSIFNSDSSYFTIVGGEGNDTIYNLSAYNGYGSIDGGEGNDFMYNNTNYVTITGGKGKDSILSTYRTTISGGADNDHIEISGSDSSVNGDAGNDHIYSEGYSATLNGDAGNDTIFSAGDYNIINGGAGNDLVSIGSYATSNTVTGGLGNDTIFGDSVSYSEYGRMYLYNNGDGYDVIYNYSSYDKVSIVSGSYTKSTVGSDVVISTYSNSNSSSANGAITLKGAAGKNINVWDSLSPYIAITSASVAANGSNKNDTIENGSGHNYVTINAGAGDDYISNNYGYYAKINGDAGNDIIDSSGDYTTIDGGAGNDRISLTSSYVWSNTIKGGKGDDTIYGSNNSTNYGHIYQYANGDGYDVIYNYGSSDTITFTDGYYSMSTVGTNVILKAYKSKSSSANGAITLAGAAGETINVKGDSIKGGNTKKWSLNYSTAKYGTSSNTLATVNGVKSVSGLSTSGKKITLKNTALKNKVTVSGSYEFDFASDYKNATISGTSKADTITARGTNLKIFGGKGNDSIKMVGTNQTVSGGDGADTFIYAANGGNEKITDFSSNDTLKIGTSGKGTYSTQTSGKNLIVSTDDGGTITLVGGAKLSDVNIAGTEKISDKGVKVSGKKITLTSDYPGDSFSLVNKYSSAVTVDASAVTHSLSIIGNREANIITGSSQDDTLNGGKGADTIYGGNGSDSIFGGIGDDELRGGVGKDTLWGGAGNDKLYGDDGADTFYYNIGEGDDTIYDYTTSVDKIVLANGTVDNVRKDDNNNVIFEIGSGQLVISGAANRMVRIDDTSGKVVAGGLWAG